VHWLFFYEFYETLNHIPLLILCPFPNSLPKHLQYSVNSADCQAGIPNGEGKQTEGFRRSVFMTPAHWRFDEVALKGQGWLSFSFQVFPVHIPHCTHDFSPLTTHLSWCLTIYFWEYRYTGGVCPNLSMKQCDTVAT